MKPFYFTICARNYLAYALTQRESLLAAEPDAQHYIFLADGRDAETASIDKTIFVEDLALPDLPGMAFRYTLMEFSTAIKPFCFKHIFDTLGADAAIYLDPDIEVFTPLSKVESLLADGASLIVTPHLLAPLCDDKRPTTLDIMRSGTFNLGFLAMAATPESLAFLDWWGGQLETQCFADLAHGLFVDQKFLDFAPSFVDHCHVLRDPGYNVAYWNLLQRPIETVGDGWSAGGAPLIFFHFSGIVPGDTETFSKHQNRITMANAGPAAALVTAYLTKLDRHGQTQWRQIRYQFDHFNDGTPIPPILRRLIPPPALTPEGFEQPDWAYWNAADPDVDQAPHRTFSRLMSAVHMSREDLRTAFPLGSESGRKRFHTWFSNHAAKECRIPAAGIEAPLQGAQGQDLIGKLRRTIRRFLKPDTASQLAAATCSKYLP